MFYRISAYNENAIIIWSSSTTNVLKYIEFLNRNREINHYQYEELGQEGYEDKCDLSCDEPHWDDFIKEELEREEVEQTDV